MSRRNNSRNKPNTTRKPLITEPIKNPPANPPGPPVQKQNDYPAPKPKRPTVAVLALFISIFGGIPGIINSINWYEDKPNFRFLNAAMADMTFDASSTNYKHKFSAFFLAGAIYNDGKEPLIPIDYQIGLKWEGEDSIKYYPAQDLPDSGILNNPTINLSKNSKLKNVWRVTTLAPKETQWVYFVFINDSPSRVAIDATERYLYCKDVTGKDRKVKILVDKIFQKGESFYVPSAGINYTEPK